MEKKRYPIIEEEDNSSVMTAAEPMGAVAMQEIKTYTIEEEPSTSYILPFIGPSTHEEAIRRIEEAEREIESGETYAWEDVLNEVRTRAGRYATEIN